MKFLACLISILCITVLATVSRAAFPCADSCVFRLCRANAEPGNILSPPGRKILLRSPKLARNPILCNVENNLGEFTTGEARVAPIGSSSSVPISQYRPNGLSKRFRVDYFKFREIRFLPGKFGVSREKSRGNQEDFVDDLCVSIPITSYQIIRKNGSVKQVNNAGPNDCVTFETTAAKVIVELIWNSAHDLDLSLVEPDGNAINRFNPRSDTGGVLAGDAQSENCLRGVLGKEQIRYLRTADVPTGLYTITLSHHNNCDGIATRYEVRVIVNGKVVLFKKGKSNLDGSAVIRTLTFDIPTGP